MSEGLEKLNTEQLDVKLDNIVLPLIEEVCNLNIKLSKALEEKDYAEYKEELYTLFAIATLKGVELAELVDERLDNALIEKVQSQQFADTLKIDATDKTREAVNALNKSSKYPNRFVLASDLEGKK